MTMKIARISGEGTIIFTDGVVFEGSFQNSKPRGIGTMFYKKEKGCRVCGDGDNGLTRLEIATISGEVTVVYNNGDKYEGAFKYSKPHGEGKMTSRDGQVCEGFWEDGKLALAWKIK